MYTGGWIWTGIPREEATNFADFYTPLGWPGNPLWSAYKPAPEFYEVAKRLAERDYKTIEERNELLKKAIELCIKDSVRVWLVDQSALWVRRAEVVAVADLAAGYSTYIWKYTMRFKDKVGGTLRIGNNEVIVDPWNPVSGSDWIYDVIISEAAEADDFASHPKTGLPIPIMVKHVWMEVEEGTLTAQNPESKDWLDLKFVPKVEVPPDAWYAWDVKAKKMITAGEAGVKAAIAKIVVDYGDVIGKHYYHDGSVMSLADWLVEFPLTFERADNASPLYDESVVKAFKVWRNNFIAWKIVSEHPLKIEYYINYTNLDAELMADWAADWPEIPWHVMAIGIMAEEKGKLAFSADKADKLKVEWMNYIGGPSLEILKSMAEEGAKTGYIPFKEFLGKYVTAEEAKARFSNLLKWYEEHGHFWVSDGPYYLDKVDVVGHTATLKNSKYIKPKPKLMMPMWLIALIIIAIAAIIAIIIIRKKKKGEKKK